MSNKSEKNVIQPKKEVKKTFTKQCVRLAPISYKLINLFIFSISSFHTSPHHKKRHNNNNNNNNNKKNSTKNQSSKCFYFHIYMIYPARLGPHYNNWVIYCISVHLILSLIPITNYGFKVFTLIIYMNLRKYIYIYIYIFTQDSISYILLKHVTELGVQNQVSNPFNSRL